MLFGIEVLTFHFMLGKYGLGSKNKKKGNLMNLTHSNIHFTKTKKSNNSSYSFDGKFVDGRMEGKGVLKISQEEQQKCLIIKENILGLPSPDVIEGDFIQGYIEGIANLTWTKSSISMNAHVTYGLLHGFFKVILLFLMCYGFKNH